MRRDGAWLKLGPLLLLLGFGCAQTHTVAVPVAEADLLKMRSRLDGKSGAVYSGGKSATTDAPPTRRELTAGTVYVEPFAVRIVDGSSEKSIPYTQVNMIRSVDHRRRKSQGAAIGLLSGVLLGGLGGYAIGKDCSPGALFCIDRAQAGATLAFTLGAIGAGAGLLAGTSSGAAADEWTFR